MSEDLNKQKSYFVRPGSAPVGTDIKLYDVGNLYVITSGVTTSGGTCGELYVEYDVLLMTPIFEPNSTSGMWVNAAGTGCTAAVPMGTDPGLSTGILSVSNNGGVLTVSGVQIGVEYIMGLGAEATAGSIIGQLSPSSITGTTNNALKHLCNPTTTAGTLLCSMFTGVCNASTIVVTPTAAGVTTFTTPSKAWFSIAAIANASI
jgi:hypothetical protein